MAHQAVYPARRYAMAGVGFEHRFQVIQPTAAETHPIRGDEVFLKQQGQVHQASGSSPSASARSR